MREPWVALICVLSLASCRETVASDPLHLKIEPAGPDTRLTLVAEPGLKLNARLKPALELADGGVIRFDSSSLTADSAYFAAPPSAIAAGRRAHWRGTLRASVCDQGKTVCRAVVMRVSG
jgi:hypothetical protein